MRGEPVMPRNSIDYEKDFYAWTVEQSRMLRSGEISSIDAENIAEELESMGRSDRRELKNRLVILVMHLLKWRHQSAARSRSWSATIDEQRLRRHSRRIPKPSANDGRNAIRSLRNSPRKNYRGNRSGR